jgi:hypothetical protein
MTFCNKLNFYGEELLTPCPTHKLEDHPCPLLYAIYLQLPSISGSHLLHLQPEAMLCCGAMDPSQSGIKKKIKNT